MPLQVFSFLYIRLVLIVVIVFMDVFYTWKEILSCITFAEFTSRSKNMY